MSLFTCFSQDKQYADSLHKAYNSEMKVVSNEFSRAYYPNKPAIYSLSEKQFLNKIDSLKRPFLNVAEKYKKSFQKTDKNFIVGFYCPSFLLFLCLNFG